MKITLEEQIRYQLLKMGKKGPLRRVLAIAGIYIFLASLHFVRYIQNNKKRLAMVMMSMVLFVAYASFSFPIFTEDEDNRMDEELAALLSDATVSLVQEEEIRMEDLDSWDEELVWDGEEVDALQEDAGQDQINLEDILSYRMEQ